MSIDYGELVYGLRELEVAPWSGGALGSWVALPGRTLTIRLLLNSAEQRANDKIAGVVAEKAGAEWELEEGAYPLEGAEVMLGGTLTTTGSSPNQVKTLTHKSGDPIPAFAIRGRAIGGKTPAAIIGGSEGGDMWLQANICIVTGNHEVSLADQAFFTPGLSGMILEHPTDGLFKEVQHETATPFS